MSKRRRLWPITLTLGASALTSCSARPGTTTESSDQAESQAVTVASPISGNSIPDGYVITPAGYVHNSCVHRISNMATVDRARNVYENGVLTATYSACAHPRIAFRGRPGPDGGVIPSSSPHSWLFTRQAPPSGQVWTALETEQKVPSRPLLNDGQTVFYWNGLETNDGTALAQPVLQWGVSAIGGGQFWAIASWSLVDDSVFATSSLVTVQPGDTIGYYLENEGQIPNSNNDALLIEALDETRGTYSGFLQNVEISGWASPGFFAIPAALEFVSAPNCDEDVPEADFNPVLVFAGTANPPTYNLTTYAPVNELQVNEGSSHCSIGICDSADFPCFGLSGSETTMYF
jgi:hypothetical protein